MKRMVVAHTALWPGLAVALFVLAFQAFAQKSLDKPRVPPGVDPGGVAVAIIGSGIDYTNPEIAKRLARDGEGEIIGWDFVDGDRRPYSSEFSATQLLTATTSGRLIFIRASMTVPQTLVQAVQMASQTPARLVLLAAEPPPPRALVVEAAHRFPQLAFIAAVGVADYDSEPPVTMGRNYIAIGTVAGEKRPVAGIGISFFAPDAIRCLQQNAALDGAGVMGCMNGEPRKPPK